LNNFIGEEDINFIFILFIKFYWNYGAILRLLLYIRKLSWKKMNINVEFNVLYSLYLFL